MIAVTLIVFTGCLFHRLAYQREDKMRIPRCCYQETAYTVELLRTTANQRYRDEHISR